MNSALAHLEDAVESQAKGNEEKVVRLTWKAASDLEYKLFLFALKYPKQTLKPS